MARYRYEPFAYAPPPDLRGAKARRWPVIIVGAGPIGLAAAIDLALHRIAAVVLDESNVVSIGSRAICWSKRSLEIFDRLGVGERMLAKGVTWQVGRLFHRDREIYRFDLLPETGHKMPAFINLQQYYVEQYLVERAQQLGDHIELRWKNRVTGVEQLSDGVRVLIETPDGSYRVEADYLLACDGAKSTIRGLLDLDFVGRVFEERFLIADVEMTADFPSERWFWFEPPFHAGQSALMHKQPEDIYRIDLQLGANADAEAEKQPERVIPRIKAVVGARPFALDWVSVYTFQCRRMARFVHDRVIFLGDSAHVVSPFGARGGNGGIQDVDNLIWKLALVLRGDAGFALIESYDEERTLAADENLLHSSRSTSFMTPKSTMEKIFRDSVLDLARDMPFARRLINSGRLSQPCSLAGLSLQSADNSTVEGGPAPGTPCIDAPISWPDGRAGWLLERLGGDFSLLQLLPEAGVVPPVAGLRRIIVARRPTEIEDAEVLLDPAGLLCQRYGGTDGVTYLVRPDQHVAARWSQPEPATIERALARCCGYDAAPGAGA